MLEYRAGLVGRDTRKELHKFSQGDSVFQVFEQRRHWDPGAAEHPGTTDALGILLHRATTSPTEFGLHAYGPFVAGLFQGRQLETIELSALRRSSRSLVPFCRTHLSALNCRTDLSVRHQKRLDPVVVPPLADPIGD